MFKYLCFIQNKNSQVIRLKSSLPRHHTQFTNMSTSYFEVSQMATVVDVLFSSSILQQVTCVLVFISLAHTQNVVGKTLI